MGFTCNRLSKNSSNILLINYDELKNNFKKTIGKISNLEIDIINTPRNYQIRKNIYTEKRAAQKEKKTLMKDFIHDEIKKFTTLPKDFTVNYLRTNKFFKLVFFIGFFFYYF